MMMIIMMTTNTTMRMTMTIDKLYLSIAVK